MCEDNGREVGEGLGKPVGSSVGGRCIWNRLIEQVIGAGERPAVMGRCGEEAIGYEFRSGGRLQLGAELPPESGAGRDGVGDRRGRLAGEASDIEG